MSPSRLTVVDYYDGATEGFIAIDGRARYFLVVAWDRGQNRRLYAATDIDPAELVRLEALLSQAGQPPSSKVWMPEWRFVDPADAAEAGEIVGRCKERLLEAGQLELGARPESAATLGSISLVPRADIRAATNSREIGDLEQWLGRLRQAGGAPE